MRELQFQELVDISPSFHQVENCLIEFEEEGIKHVKMFVIITLAYVIFWGPLFVVTLINISLDWQEAKSSVSHEVRRDLHSLTVLNTTKEFNFRIIGFFQKKILERNICNLELKRTHKRTWMRSRILFLI